MSAEEAMPDSDAARRRTASAASAPGAALTPADSEARLRSVFESLVEGVVIQGRDGQIVDFNPAAAAILGHQSKH